MVQVDISVAGQEHFQLVSEDLETAVWDEDNAIFQKTTRAMKRLIYLKYYSVLKHQSDIENFFTILFRLKFSIKVVRWILGIILI